MEGETLALSDISFSMQAGEFVAIVGPSGCGKSTLLKTICGIQPVSKGQILLDGQGLLTLPRNLLAQKTAYLAQNRQIPDITVERLILHGRFPYLGYPRRYRSEDYIAARNAMDFLFQGLPWAISTIGIINNADWCMVEASNIINRTLPHFFSSISVVAANIIVTAINWRRPLNIQEI